MMKRLAFKVKRLRAERNWSQHQLAVKAGVAQRTISYLENEDSRRNSITLDVIEKITRVFGYELWEFLVDDDDLYEVVKYYQLATETGRQNIRRIAYLEAHYKTLQELHGSMPLGFKPLGFKHG